MDSGEPIPGQKRRREDEPSTSASAYGTPVDEEPGIANDEREQTLCLRLAEMLPSCEAGTVLKVLRQVLSSTMATTNDDVIFEVLSRVDGLKESMKLLGDRLPKDLRFLMDIDRFVGIRQLFPEREPKTVAEQIVTIAEELNFDEENDVNADNLTNRIVEALLFRDPLAAPGFESIGAADASGATYPNHWDLKQGGCLVDVPEYSQEYNTVAKAFQASDLMSFVPITRIQRIQNPGLWRQYQMRRSLILDKVGENELNECHLWHANNTLSADSISVHGFDFREMSRVGEYGDGVYFSPHPYLVVQDAMRPVNVVPVKGKRKSGKGKTANVISQVGNQGGYVIYTRAICGRSTPGRGGLKRPPYIDPNDINKGLYDSCVGGQDGSSFVIFDNSQVYPEYVLFYDASVIPLLQYN